MPWVSSGFSGTLLVGRKLRVCGRSIQFHLSQAAADFNASVDSSNDYDGDEEKHLENNQDDSEDDENHDGKPTNNYFCLFLCAYFPSLNDFDPISSK